MQVRPAYSVTIQKHGETLLYYFVLAPVEFIAARYTTERTNDFKKAFGWDDVDFILEYLNYERSPPAAF